MLLKTLILPSETSPNNICQRIEFSKHTTKLSTNWPYLDLSQNTPEKQVTEESLQAPYRKKLNSKSPFQNLELSRKDKSLHQNSEDTMTEETCPSEWIIKILHPSWPGKSQSKPLTTTITCQSSSTAPDKNSIHTDHSQCLEPMTYWTREETRFSQSFLSWSSQSRVKIFLSSRFEHQRSLNHLNYVENNPKASLVWRNDRRSPRALLQTDPSNLQHF